MSTDINKLVPGMEVKINERGTADLHFEATRTFNRLAVKRAVTQLLKGFGVNTQDENFKGTPERVTKLWAEWMKSHDLKMSAFSTVSEGAVTLVGHSSISVCPHHLLPYTMVVDVGYIPQGWAVGLSKLPRLVDLACGAFILQEHIGEFVVQVLNALLLPRGVMCRVRGTHGCMRLRGVKTTGFVATSAMRGVYLTDEKARAEFMKEVGEHEPRSL